MDVNDVWHMLVRRVVEARDEGDDTDEHVMVNDVHGSNDLAPIDIEKSIRWVCMGSARGLEQCVDCTRYCAKIGIRSMIEWTYQYVSEQEDSD